MRRVSYVAALALCLIPTAGTAQAVAPRNVARYVNPFNGTQPGAPDFGTGGGAGNTFPGPAVPFGMIQWGPDTAPGSANPGGGYAYDDQEIRGFSVRRLSGAGCANEGDVPFLPTTSPITSSPVAPLSTEFSGNLLPSFNHRDEGAAPGFYRVGLDPGTPDRIGAQLTATRRTGVARLSFPPSETASVLINAAGSRTGASDAAVQINPAAREVTGSTSSGGFCLEPSHYKIYFAAQFNRPFAAHGTWTGQALAPNSTAAQDTSPLDPLAQGPDGPLGVTRDGFTVVNGSGPTAQAGAYVTFDTRRRQRVEVRVGISFVSVEGARRNLAAESSGRSFGSIRRASHRTWNRALDRVDVRGGALADRRTFYSMLYHALLAPSTFSDVNGRYAGMDGEVHTAKGYTQYADFSGWDVYRSQMPLLALLAPGRASDIVRSLLADQRESGWLPKWSLANGQTEVMTGDPAAPTIASIWALGARRFDPNQALAAMLKGATQSGVSSNAGYVERQALDDYQRLGYIPDERNANLVGVGVDAWRRAMPAPTTSALDLAWGSAGTTLEYATADFAVARMAAAVGDRETCEEFLQRSENWRNVFDPSIGYVRPRLANGAFVSPYDPNTNDPLSSQGFAEGDGAQYTWMVPQDPDGLFTMLGGRDAAAARLDQFFGELNAGYSSAHAFLGNEPNSNAPWLYDWLGQPYEAQRIVRSAILTLFHSTPGGYPGNDDLGQMSAWYVLGAIGLYPQIPGTDVLALGSPLFRRTELRLGKRRLIISAPRAARRAPYVRGLLVDGRRWAAPWIRLARLERAGRITFALARHPDRRWGSDPSAAPPSFGATTPGATCARRAGPLGRATRGDNEGGG